MSKAPLFSTYRQGENRVTASMLAVFERIDLSLLERILRGASGEPELQMMSFRNQDAGDDSVPDATICAHFRYLFEVKIVRDYVGEDQLRNHLKSFTGEGDEHLFVVTPDEDEPEQVITLREEGAPVRWMSFAAVADAIVQALADTGLMIFEHEELLLREVVRLFQRSGLLDAVNDAVIVPGERAHEFYRRYGLYNRDTDRSIQPHVRYLGFSHGMAIHREIPAIRARYPDIHISPQSASRLAESDDDLQRDVGVALLLAIDDGHFCGGARQQIFLLSPPDDNETLLLPHTIKILGAPWQNQRYFRSEALREAPRTTEELLDDPNGE